MATRKVGESVTGTVSNTLYNAFHQRMRSKFLDLAFIALSAKWLSILIDERSKLTTSSITCSSKKYFLWCNFLALKHTRYTIYTFLMFKAYSIRISLFGRQAFELCSSQARILLAVATPNWLWAADLQKWLRKVSINITHLDNRSAPAYTSRVWADSWGNESTLVRAV